MTSSFVSRVSGLFAVVSVAGLVACSASGDDASPGQPETTGSVRSAVVVDAAPAWLAYPGQIETHYRSSFIGIVGESVRMAPLYGGGAPTRFELLETTLPPGLAFDPSTGILEGTVSAASPRASYHVRASNAFGSVTESIWLGSYAKGGNVNAHGFFLSEGDDPGTWPTWREACQAQAGILCALYDRLGTPGAMQCSFLDAYVVNAPTWPQRFTAQCLTKVVDVRPPELRGGPPIVRTSVAAMDCGEGATTNIVVSPENVIQIADPNFKPSPDTASGTCMCPLGTSWNSHSNGGRGRCERQPDCTITTTSCPNFPAYVGTFSDVADDNVGRAFGYSMDTALSPSDEKRLCASRAKGWADQCGTSSQVKAEYTVNGVVMDTTVYGSAPPPPAAPVPAPDALHGDLLDRFGFVACASYPGVAKRQSASVEAVAAMSAETGRPISVSGCANPGQKLVVRPGAEIVVSAVVRDAQGTNRSPFTFANPALAALGIAQPMNAPVLDHVDVLGGAITAGTSLSASTGAALASRFDAATWAASADGTRRMTMRIPGVNVSQFLRLRVANLPANAPSPASPDAGVARWADLGFDSATIGVEVIGGTPVTLP
jgi:hypothetical protein